MSKRSDSEKRDEPPNSSYMMTLYLAIIRLPYPIAVEDQKEFIELVRGMKGGNACKMWRVSMARLQSISGIEAIPPPHEYMLHAASRPMWNLIYDPRLVGEDNGDEVIEGVLESSSTGWAVVRRGSTTDRKEIASLTSDSRMRRRSQAISAFSEFHHMYSDNQLEEANSKGDTTMFRDPVPISHRHHKEAERAEREAGVEPFSSKTSRYVGSGHAGFRHHATGIHLTGSARLSAEPIDETTSLASIPLFEDRERERVFTVLNPVTVNSRTSELIKDVRSGTRRFASHMAMGNLGRITPWTYGRVKRIWGSCLIVAAHIEDKSAMHSISEDSMFLFSHTGRNTSRILSDEVSSRVRAEQKEKGTRPDGKVVREDGGMEPVALVDAAQRYRVLAQHARHIAAAERHTGKSSGVSSSTVEPLSFLAAHWILTVDAVVAMCASDISVDTEVRNTYYANIARSATRLVHEFMLVNGRVVGNVFARSLASDLEIHPETKKNHVVPLRILKEAVNAEMNLDYRAKEDTDDPSGRATMSKYGRLISRTLQGSLLHHVMATGMTDHHGVAHVARTVFRWTAEETIKWVRAESGHVCATPARVALEELRTMSKSRKMDKMNLSATTRIALAKQWDESKGHNVRDWDQSLTMLASTHGKRDKEGSGGRNIDSLLEDRKTEGDISFEDRYLAEMRRAEAISAIYQSHMKNDMIAEKAHLDAPHIGPWTCHPVSAKQGMDIPNHRRYKHPVRYIPTTRRPVLIRHITDLDAVDTIVGSMS